MSMHGLREDSILQGIWASAAILANSGRSALSRWSNSAGVLATASLPVTRNRSTTSGADSAALAPCWIAFTMSRGVLAGANHPCQLDDSKPASPLSAMVGHLAAPP